MSDYRYRLIALVPDGLQGTANLFAGQLDPDSGGGDTFADARLSPTGEAPATWAFTNTKLSEAGYQGVMTAIPQLEAAAQAGGLSKPLAYIIDVSSGNEEAGPLVHTNSDVELGQSWSWAQSLSDAGLVMVPVVEYS